MNKTILLAGASGFLGSFLLTKLVDNGHHVVILKRAQSDLGRIEGLLPNIKVYDIDQMSIAFQDNKIDIVINTAISYDENRLTNDEILTSNLVFPLSLLDHSRKHNAIFINTDTIMQEKKLNRYTLSKSQFLEWLKAFYDSMTVINLRIGSMFGPRDSSKKFIPWLINELLSEKNIIQLTAGEQKRDYVFVEDVAEAYLLLIGKIELLRGYNEYDICTGTRISVKEFVLKVKSVVQEVMDKGLMTELAFGAIPNRNNEVMDLQEGLSNIAELGWEARTGLGEGLRKTVEYYLKKRDEKI